MNEPHYYSFKSFKPLTLDQFCQIFLAIQEGQYSWACILLLKYTDNNPLDYIPERTYYRLVIKNKQSLTS